MIRWQGFVHRDDHSDCAHPSLTSPARLWRTDKDNEELRCMFSGTTIWKRPEGCPIPRKFMTSCKVRREMVASSSLLESGASCVVLKNIIRSQRLEISGFFLLFSTKLRIPELRKHRIGIPMMYVEMKKREEG